MTTISDITLQMFSKWRNLTDDEQKQISGAVGVSQKRISGFFNNQNTITADKLLLLEKHLS
jgi:plasmid maintenance system antidote protein VapI